MSQQERQGPGRRPEDRITLARAVKERYGSSRQAIDDSMFHSHTSIEPNHAPIKNSQKVNEHFVRKLIDSNINLQVQEIFEEDQNKAVSSKARYHIIDSSYSENITGPLVADDYSEESRP